MTSSIPYLASPGSIKTALERIRQAATPDRVTKDFVNTKLSMKGGTGAALIPYLKKIGLVASDGSPTDLYKKFRNTATGSAAIAAAVKHGYKVLEHVNEYFYDLNDKDLKALIVQATGTEADSPVAKLGFSTLKALKSFANFEETLSTERPEQTQKDDVGRTRGSGDKRVQNGGVGLNLSYTINLNLPATTDQAVFNAIFRSLRDHLLSNAD